MKSQLKHEVIFIILASFFCTWPAWSLPIYEQTMIPFSAPIAPGDEEIANIVFGLEFYADSRDKNRFYYMPPFQGQNISNFVIYEEIKAFMKTKKYVFERFQTIQNYYDHELPQEISKLKQDLYVAKENLLDELQLFKRIISNNPSSNNPDTFSKELLRKENLVRSLAERLENHQLILALKLSVPEHIKKQNEFLIMDSLYAAGFRAHRFDWVNYGLAHASASYGGVLMIKFFMGFTKKQLDALKNFIAKYAPSIKISLLPMESFTSYPLTEISREKAHIFRQVMSHESWRLHGYHHHHESNIKRYSYFESASVAIHCPHRNQNQW